MFPNVLSVDEMSDRFKFHTWYHTFFTSKVFASDDFPDGVDVSDIRNWFLDDYPNSIMSPDSMIDLLSKGGYISPKEQKLHVEINESSIRLMSDILRGNIIRHVEEERRMKMMHKVHGRNSVISIPVCISSFWSRYVFDDKFPGFHSIPGAQRKVSKTVVYETYYTHCLNEHIEPLSRIIFDRSMHKLGATTSKGYYDGASGISLYENIAFPKKHLEESILLGVGIIEKGRIRYFTDGVEVDSMLEPLEDYLERRRSNEKIPKILPKDEEGTQPTRTSNPDEDDAQDALEQETTLLEYDVGENKTGSEVSEIQFDRASEISSYDVEDGSDTSENVDTYNADIQESFYSEPTESEVREILAAEKQLNGGVMPDEEDLMLALQEIYGDIEIKKEWLDG